MGRSRARLGEHAHGRAELAWRAVAALERVVPQEGPLQRVEVTGLAEALDRLDAGAVVGDREGEAGVDPAGIGPPSAYQHRARAALAVVAALLGTGQAEPFA